MSSLQSTSPSQESVALAEYIADRERLTGAARRRFLRFIDQSLGFHQPTRSANWRSLFVISLAAGVICLAVDRWLTGADVPTWRAAAWLVCAGIGASFSLLIGRAEQKKVDVDRDIHWRVYCLVLRPVVLAERPGLLDRNLADDKSDQEQLLVRPSESFRGMVRDGGADLWWSGALGLWGGMLVLLISRWFTNSAPATWMLLIPAAGIVAGPLAWAFWQCAAYRFAMRNR